MSNRAHSEESFFIKGESYYRLNKPKKERHFLKEWRSFLGLFKCEMEIQLCREEVRNFACRTAFCSNH